MISQRKRFKAGELVFREGQSGDCAYIIESGRIEIFIGDDDNPVTLTHLGEGEIFGEMSVIDGSPRSASARAIEPCELVLVSSEAISERIDSADPIVRLLISMLLTRMRQANQSATGGPKIVQPEPAGILTDEGGEGQTQKVLEKMRIESELKQALVSNEFMLHFQPIMDLQKGRISGFEALIRWNSPTRGLVRPDIFMGIAEETSLIVPIGKWVIEKSAEALKVLNHRYRQSHPEDEDLFMSINISGRQFHDDEFFSHLEGAIAQAGVKTSQIKLEVTERIFMEGPSALQAINRCRDMGFHVALDDFGTGYSSLSYLAQFQVDSLKVDQSFIRSMLQDEKTFVITNAIIAMANGLGIPVIAEGIEIEKEHRVLVGMECRFAQGYLFSRPIPLGDALNYVSISNDFAETVNAS
ncbi:EAL domain-containing protein [Pseudobacteriovorax antillogorgiicola]|uniref:EAL domain, c-di-GMP-specific phosphodiesterase class I (Or its enzymatically inactive variant) n=1 Tax=Pseudobacteriovorax antillogorgiicola TaxID=1513793 RepID=A0A1Y6BTU2_9BACT|nr:EAL domain-containing protein [Pseudobacteriovorax antillogorgiicola]TCS53890.1 EAL domain-containing protein (putative c-di-GMP-specific phosphodiesterase class I) [Pseudobacteriovorax antillogorgiicola]SMF20928.1 EAL domain, c-di-GMP-specific phosphodiesterase class I (or its enzymatically inactive variant) [Pseudobacteriovorax antillogorgiicola]